MVTVKLFVEGGGDSDVLHRKCREGFRTFLENAGLRGIMPRIVACGSRKKAYDNYCTAMKYGENAVLLIDSEAPIDARSIPDAENIENWKPWIHLKDSDNWDKPGNANDEDCHLMVEVMESWFLADNTALKTFYQQGFNEGAIPTRADIESHSKASVLSILEKATRNTAKGTYSKGGHSFDILAELDPQVIMAKSPWAKRFVVLLAQKMRKR